MKTITVLTLVFLPSTMLASLWDSGIFTLEPQMSWRVYVGAAVALTAAVFGAWFLYVWMSTRRARAKMMAGRGSGASTVVDEERGKVT